MSYRYVYCMCIYIYIYICTYILLHHHVCYIIMLSLLCLRSTVPVRHLAQLMLLWQVPWDCPSLATSGACTLHCVKAYHSGPHLTKKPGAVSIRSMSSSATALRSQKGRRKKTKHLIGLLCPRDRRPFNIFI